MVHHGAEKWKLSLQIKKEKIIQFLAELIKLLKIVNSVLSNWYICRFCSMDGKKTQKFSRLIKGFCYTLKTKSLSQNNKFFRIFSNIGNSDLKGVFFVNFTIMTVRN